jgi:hypothetical protein
LRVASDILEIAVSFLDVFAVFILLVLAVTAIAVLVGMGMAPGYIAKARKHPWPQAVEVAGWVSLIFGLVLWPLALVWAFVDIPKSEARK